MTTDQALETIERHRGRIEADHKCPETDEESGRQVSFLVTLWQPPHFSRGVHGGGDTLVEATQVAVERLDAAAQADAAAPK